MMTHKPFTDFALSFSNYKFPLSMSQWINLFEDYFNEIKTENKGTAEIQFTNCETYKIAFQAPIITSGINKYDSLPFCATLCNSDSLFYLLVQIDNKLIGNAISSFLKSNEYFISLGGGRFKSKINNVIMSLEEDEFDKPYLLITSHYDLLTIDALFNFTRQFILE